MSTLQVDNEDPRFAVGQDGLNSSTHVPSKPFMFETCEMMAYEANVICSTPRLGNVGLGIMIYTNLLSSTTSTETPRSLSCLPAAPPSMLRHEVDLKVHLINLRSGQYGVWLLRLPCDPLGRPARMQTAAPPTE